MKREEAMQHALGYAAGREDASGERTLGDTDLGNGQTGRDGWLRFADAYAQGWDDFNAQRRVSMTDARDAYDRWQESGGRSIFTKGDLTLTDDQREELRALYPDAFGNFGNLDEYYARREEFQAQAWDAAEQRTPAG